MARSSVTRKLLVLVALAATASGVWAFRNAGHWLIRNDRPEPGAAYLAILMGDSTPSRADAALALLKADPDTRLLLAHDRAYGFVKAGLRKGDADLYSAYLLQNGIEPSRLVLIPDCDNTSTLEEAQCVLTFLQGEGPLPERLTVVTSWYHTSRAGWLFEKVWQGTNTKIEMTPAMPEGFNPDQWWRGEDSFLAVFDEYLKWTYWLTKSL